MYHQLTSEQRYYIEVSLQNGMSKKMIAENLKVHQSTVYREIARNKGQYRYHHRLAQQKSDGRKHRMRSIRTFTLDMRKRIFSLLVDEQWSPEQIKGYMERRGEACASVETIYAYIRFDRENGGTLWKHCRHGLRHVHRQVSCRYRAIKDRKMIDLRPACADGTRFGDWEMDCIVGREGKSTILTMTERSTNFLIMARLPSGRKSKELARQVVRQLLPYKDSVLTITTDNGPEFADFKYIEKRLDTKVYFAHPYCSWEKGAIENANALIRQYLPKQLDFNDVTDSQIKQVQFKINRRPRKKLQFEAPKSVFYRNL
jgi:IS30 family transposase